MSRAVRRRTPALPFDALVAGRYRIEALLGEGGMSEVFRARDQVSGRAVAVKVLRADIASNREAVERAKREGELLSQLDNPAIVSVETWGELEDGTVFLVMELLEGETLGERMRRGPMEPAELAPIVAGTCAGLHAAHSRGIVHRDLKPDNIFLCPTDDGIQVKLLDFGISKVYGGERLTHTGEVLGTPRYMSPEQLGAEPDIDARVDVYALGVILYEALAGKPPFLGTTPTDLVIAILNGKAAPLRSVRPELPEAVEAVVMRAMSRVRGARYDTARSLGEAYVDAVGGVAAVRNEQRRGMATRAMGGMVGGPSTVPPPGFGSFPGTRPPKPPIGGDDLAGNLRLGTFSGLELGPAAPSSAGGPHPNEVETAPGKKRRRDVPVIEPAEEVKTARAKAQSALPPTREMPLALAEAKSALPRSAAATVLMEHEPLFEKPATVVPPQRRKGTMLLLVLAALLAGALSASAVIATLHFYYRPKSEQPNSGTPQQATPAPKEEDETPAAEPERPTAETEAEPAEVAANEPASDPSNRTEKPSSTVRAPSTRRVRSTPAVSKVRPAPSESSSTAAPPETPTPIRLLQDAQQALRSGDPERCIAILDDAIRQGAPALALRRRGDCYEAAGQRQRAIADYQRFCRLVPENPSIADVRPLLASWGYSCP